MEIIRETLGPLLELRDVRCTPRCLEVMAYALCEGEQSEAAVRLFAAAETMRDLTGMQIPKPEQRNQEKQRASLEKRLGVASFATAWAEGREMNMEKAVEYALEISSVPVRSSIVQHERL